MCNIDDADWIQLTEEIYPSEATIDENGHITLQWEGQVTDARCFRQILPGVDSPIYDGLRGLS